MFVVDDIEMESDSVLVNIGAASDVEDLGAIASPGSLRVAVASSRSRRRLNKSPIVMDSEKIESLEARLLANGDDDELVGKRFGANLSLKGLQDLMALTPPPVSKIIDDRRPKSSAESYEAVMFAEKSNTEGTPKEVRKLDFSDGSPPSRWNSTGQVALMARGEDLRTSVVGKKVRAMLSQLKKKRGSGSQSPAQEPSSAKRAGRSTPERVHEVEAMETPSSPDREAEQKESGTTAEYIISASADLPLLNASSTPSRSTEKPKPKTAATPNRRSQMVDVSQVLEEISEMHGEGPLEESCGALLSLKERLESRLAQKS